MDLSIIILAYKSKTDLQVLLPSIFASLSKYTYEVIVVDNGSKDGTVEWFHNQISNFQRPNSNFKIIENTKNLGFAAGNNIGIRAAQGRYILLLNPDTKIAPDTLQVMLDFMQARPDVGIAGCKLIKPDGTLDLACRRSFPNPWNSFLRLSGISNRSYNLMDYDENLEMEVDSVVGAFLLIRKSLIDRIGLLDERFFMYGEDLDWCWRCKEAGFKVWYYPKTTVIHRKGSSSRKSPFRMLKAFHDSMWIFYKKHQAGRYPAIFNWLVFLGIYARLAVLSFVNLFKADRRVSK